MAGITISPQLRESPETAKAQSVRADDWEKEKGAASAITRSINFLTNSVGTVPPNTGQGRKVAFHSLVK
ncbi:MAG TPA: hypothetical protein VN911_11520 [Candidatus Acidoferrum sp.]|nr:hypothetical protein [Candidatus Acidoferrum sp.]